jgi:hypothetical protein
MIRCFVIVCVFSVLWGCQDVDDALKNNSSKRVGAPGGLATAGDIDDVQQAASGAQLSGQSPASAGTQSPQAGGPSGSPAQSGSHAPQFSNATNTAPPVQPSPAASQDGSILGRMTAQVIDYNAYKSNPFIVVVDNQITGNDPLTVAASTYVAATSRASAANFKHQLNILKATSGKPPTFKEYTDLSKKMRIDLAQLPRYQAYAYDGSTGGLFVIENKEYKIKLFREAGVPIEAGDRVYEEKLKQRAASQPAANGGGNR